MDINSIDYWLNKFEDEDLTSKRSIEEINIEIKKSLKNGNYENLLIDDDELLNKSEKPGIIIKRTDIKIQPHENIVLEPNNKHLDMNQMTALNIYDIVDIKEETKNWYYINSSTADGWIKKSDVALIKNRKEISNIKNSKNFILVNQSYLETEFNVHDDRASFVEFFLGDKIPLSQDYYDEYPQPGYKIKIPVKNKDNYVEFIDGFIALNKEIEKNYLNYTRKNLLKTAFKMLGEAYGWGSRLRRRDCSSYIMDIMKIFGIKIPRNSGIQEIAGNFNCIKKENIDIEKIKPGDILYMKGHVMLYIGKDKEKHYVIHSGAGYSEKNEIKNVYSVFIMDIEKTLKSGKSTYIDALTSVVKLY